MARDFSNVAIQVGIDLSEIKGRLLEDEVQIMDDHADRMRTATKEHWTGWRYQGVSAKARGNSGRAWRSKVQATEGTRGIILENRARGFYGKKPYAAFVHRAGTKATGSEEWRTVLKLLIDDHLPALKADLTASILRNLSEPRAPKRVRENKSIGFTTLNLVG